MLKCPAASPEHKQLRTRAGLRGLDIAFWFEWEWCSIWHVILHAAIMILSSADVHHVFVCQGCASFWNELRMHLISHSISVFELRNWNWSCIWTRLEFLQFRRHKGYTVVLRGQKRLSKKGHTNIIYSYYFYVHWHWHDTGIFFFYQHQSWS